MLTIEPNARYRVERDRWVGDWQARRYTPDGSWEGKDFRTWQEAYAYAYHQAKHAIREVP